MKVKVERYDAFSETPGKGNPAGIILNGDAYTEAQMQTIARLVGYNECFFVCSSLPLSCVYAILHRGTKQDCAVMPQSEQLRHGFGARG